MKICGTNLVPIFITLVFCGFIFVYFNMRLAEVKSSIEKQNRVLTAFITNVQNDIRSGGMMFGQCAMGSGACVMAESGAMGAGVAGAMGAGASVAGANHLASEEALQAVRRNEKIVVSDDEDDDDSDEESDSEDSDDESGSDSEDEEDAKISIIPSAISQDSSVVSLELISDNLTLDFESLPEMVSLDSSSALLIQDSLKVFDLDATLIDATQSVDAAHTDATHSDAAKTDIIYESMKVDDLRKIVADLNLAVKDEAKKLKKPELLALLKK